MDEGHLLADIPFPSKWVTSFNVHLRIFSLLCKGYILITIVFLTSNFFGGWTHCNIVAEELSAGSGGKITQKWNFIFTKKKISIFSPWNLTSLRDSIDFLGKNEEKFNSNWDIKMSLFEIHLEQCANSLLLIKRGETRPDWNAKRKWDGHSILHVGPDRKRK